jgi:hypothetical protein
MEILLNSVGKGMTVTEPVVGKGMTVTEPIFAKVTPARITD